MSHGSYKKGRVEPGAHSYHGNHTNHRGLRKRMDRIDRRRLNRNAQKESSTNGES